MLVRKRIPQPSIPPCPTHSFAAVYPACAFPNRDSPNAGLSGESGKAAVPPATPPPDPRLRPSPPAPSPATATVHTPVPK
ncbi:uncharacterized protein K441DRAFT_664567 [Cenococcum geophilum 1.58]|uniref:uncharacterized protein n=1 Tax=Cenococcum geophilum 1.58 TaxID=794803 RepID=UPI003590078F|nr:hypothetical protein K441DRAFT_664567 [Cenococcum geophilum 1.58]